MTEKTTTKREFRKSTRPIFLEKQPISIEPKSGFIEETAVDKIAPTSPTKLKIKAKKASSRVVFATISKTRTILNVGILNSFYYFLKQP